MYMCANPLLGVLVVGVEENWAQSLSPFTPQHHDAQHIATADPA